MNLRISLSTQRIIAIVLLLIISLNALAAGFSFMIEPSGKGLGISTDYLQHSPFDTFLIPGLVLFVVNGVFNLFTAILAILRSTYYQDMIFVQGVILMGWIVVQMLMVRDFNWMHAACLIIGYLLTRYGRQLKAGVTASS